MRNARWILVLLLLSSCSSVPPSTARIPSSLVGGNRAEGGVDGGGGNVLVSPPASPEQIVNAIQHLPWMMVQVLHFHELLSRSFEYRADTLSRERFGNPGSVVIDFDKHLTTIYEKFFPAKGDSVFEEIARVEFQALKKGDCYDLRFHEKDASAFNKNPREICVSVERLAATLHTDDLAGEVLALAGHELAHRMGGSEEEAQAFQEAIRRTLRQSSFEQIKRRMTAGFTMLDWRYLDFVKELSGEKFHKRNLAKLCLHIGTLSTEIRSHLLVISFAQIPDGFLPSRLQGLRALIAADLQALALRGYCRTKSEQGPGVVYGRTFRPLDIYSLQEEGEFSLRVEDPSFKMMYGFAGHLEELRFNLAQVDRSVGIFLKNLKLAPR